MLHTENSKLFKESLIEDKLVIGINDKKVQERLPREDVLDLNKVVQINMQSW